MLPFLIPFNLLGLLLLSILYRLISGRRAQVRIIVEHLAALTRRGLPLQTGLRMLGRDLGGYVGVRLTLIARRLEEGGRLGEAIEDSPHVFPPILRRMVRLGEVSGNLSGCLEEARHSYARLAEAPSRTLYTALYPLLLSACVASIFALMSLAIFPKFRDIFLSMGVTTPGPFSYDTSMGLIAAANQIVLFLSVAAILVVSFGGASPHYGYSLLRPMKRIADPLTLRLPGIGRALREGSLQQFAVGVGLLLRAGGALPEAARVVAEAEPNGVLRRRYLDFAARLADGERPGKACRETLLVSEDFIWFLETGEAGGALGDHLLQAGAHYETRVRLWAEIASRAIIPFFILLNGLVVLSVFFMTLGSCLKIQQALTLYALKRSFH